MIRPGFSGPGERTTMSREAGIALRTFLLPLASARALKIGIFIMMLFLGLVVMFVLLKPYAEGFFEATLLGLRKLAIVPGLPVPIARPSILITGIISAPVPVKKH